MCPIRTAPAHDPASVVGHGDRKGRKDEYRHRGRVMNRKTKKARADAHRSLVRADSCLSGFWSMPCDSISAAFPQRFAPSRCAFAAPWPSLVRLAGLPPDLRRISRGEKIPHGGGHAVFPATAKTSTGRGEGARNPAGAGLSFRAPKRPPVSLAISAAEAACFCSFPPQSYGCGSGGTGSGGCPDP